MQPSFSFPPLAQASPVTAKAIGGHRVSATPRHATFAQAGLEAALVTTTHPATGTMRPMYHIPPLAQYQAHRASISGQPNMVAMRSQSFQAGVGMPVTQPTPLRRMTKADFVAIMEEIYDALPDPHSPQGQLYHILQDVQTTLLSESRAREDWQRKMEEDLGHFKTSVSNEILALEKQIKREVTSARGLAPLKSADSGFAEDTTMEVDSGENVAARRPVSNLRGL